MTDRFKAFWLGLFVLGAIAVLGWLMLFLKPTVGDGGLLLTVRFSNIGNVEVGTRVTYAGKPVGQVSEIKEIKDSRSGPVDEYGNLYLYQLTLKVDSSVRVYTYDEIVFATTGLLGEKSIAILPKAAYPGALPAQDVTHEILYAQSTDKLEAALNQITGVADTFEEAMDGVSDFLGANAKEFNQALTSFTGAAEEITVFMERLNDTNLACTAEEALKALKVTMDKADELLDEIEGQKLVSRLGKSVDNIATVTDKIANSEGTLGRLISSDSLYLQMTSLMCKVETLFNDINHYGLLFQYNKGWQRQRTARKNRMQRLCTPCDFYAYFNEEMGQVTVSLSRVHQLLEQANCEGVPLQDECFAESFRELLGRVQNLEASLKLYTEMLDENYCNACKGR